MGKITLYIMVGLSAFIYGCKKNRTMNIAGMDLIRKMKQAKKHFLFQRNQLTEKLFQAGLW